MKLLGTMRCLNIRQIKLSVNLVCVMGENRGFISNFHCNFWLRDLYSMPLTYFHPHITFGSR